MKMGISATMRESMRVGNQEQQVESQERKVNRKMENQKYWEGCYISEERWLKYCKGNKRKSYFDLPAQIIINENKVVTSKEYWENKEKEGK